MFSFITRNDGRTLRRRSCGLIFLKWILILMTACMVYEILNNAIFGDTSLSDSGLRPRQSIFRWGESKKKNFPEEAIPPKYRDYCQFLEDPLVANEGLDVDPAKYKLRGVLIATRHGERSPLIPIDASSGLSNGACAPHRESDRKLFGDYQKLLDSKRFKQFLSVDSRFEIYSHYPHPSKCMEGQLTAEGALQHSKMGTMFAKRYRHSSLFDKDQTLVVKVISSNYSRTYQSAIAFTSGFLYSLKQHVPHVNISFSPYTFLCEDKWCECVQTENWQHMFGEAYVHYFQTHSPKQFRDEMEIFKHIEITKSGKDPIKFLDRLLGAYVCRRKPLPCTENGDCVTYKLVTELLDYITDRAEKMFVMEDEYIASKLQLSVAHNVLSNIIRAVDGMRKNPKLNVFEHYSGHDVTLAPLLRILQLQFEEPPRYASRVTFEIFESESTFFGENLSFRLLYNGQDKTKELSFCSLLHNGLCPVKDLIKYFDKGLWKLSKKFSSMKGMCAA